MFSQINGSFTYKFAWKGTLAHLCLHYCFMIDHEVRFGYSHQHLWLHLEGATTLYRSCEKSITLRLMGSEALQPIVLTAEVMRQTRTISIYLHYLRWCYYGSCMHISGNSAWVNRCLSYHWWPRSFRRASSFQNLANLRFHPSSQNVCFAGRAPSAVIAGVQLAVSIHGGEETTEIVESLFKEISELSEVREQQITFHISPNES